MSEELENAAEGVSRRSMIKKSALVGGTMVWAAPVVQSITSPAFGDSHGTPEVDGQAISFIALALICDGTTYRVKFEESGGSFLLECGVNFSVGNCPTDPTGDPAPAPSCPAGLTASDAVLNTDGTVTIDIGSCTIDEYIVKCGQSCIEDGDNPSNPTQGDSGSVTFFPCPKPQ